MSATDEPRAIPFITFTDIKKADPKMRKFIRSHVMLGKNRGKTQHVKRGEEKNFKAVNGPSSSSMMSRLAIPRKVGTDLSFTRFADVIEPSVVAVVLKCCENCTAGQVAWPHFLKALQLLRERLSLADDEVKLSKPTISVVLALAIHARILGEHEAARHHLEGLRKIVDLRGGVASFNNNGKLLIEILRYDIWLALHSGSTPFFFNNPSSEAFLPYPDLGPPLLHETTTTAGFQFEQDNILSNLNDELAQAWGVMNRFSSLINLATHTIYRLPKETLLDTMASVMYRLLHPRFENSSIDEAIRLGLLAFSSRIFLQWQDVGLSSPFLYYLQRLPLNLKSLDVSLNILLWLLMIGAISIFSEADDAWLKPMLRANIDLCKAGLWSEIQDILRSFM